jgi:amino acid adenylation domain-containing protein
MPDSTAAREQLLARLLADSGFQLSGKRSVPRRAPDAEVPLSSAQRRLWFLDRLAQDNAAYVMSMTHRITGELDVPALTGALQAVIARHEALRARIVDAGEPVLVIADTAEAPLHRHQVADETQLLALVAEETGRPIATDRAPMLRASLITLPDDQHVLVLCVHHIVCDDLSLNVLNQDLTAAYSAIVDGQPAAADEPSVRFGDYLVWLHSQTKGDPAYWVDHLKDAPALLELPTDRHRPAVRRFRGESVPAKIPVELSDSVRELARRTETTPFMVMLAAFSVLLARYSDSSDIVIGAPVANRTLPELDNVVGMFVNTIALRTDLSGDPTLGDVLAMARKVTVAGLGHADVPLDEVIDLVNPPRDLGYNPLFQVMLVVNPAGRPTDTPGLRMRAEGLAETPARFDLTLVVTDAPDGLRAHFDFDADLFDKSTVDSMGYALRRVLRAMVAEPDRRAWEIDVAEPVHAVMSNAPAGLVHDLIAAQAARTPDALAVTGDGAAIAYAELDRKANQLAWRLRDLGVGPDVLVGLGLRAGVDAIAGILGILRAGGAYLPLDPQYPRSRLDFLLADSGASVVVTTSAHQETFPDGLFLDELTEGPDNAPPVEVGPEDLAYVIYTSGSTGEPKGVQVTHSALANLAVAFRDLHGFDPATRLLMVPPVSFDASAGDIFPALISGSTLVTVSEPASLTADVLRSLCTEHGMTAVDAPVALWRQWVNDLGDSGLGGLTTMMVGGEQVPRDTLRTWASLTGDKVAFYNHYGPTEATVCALTYRTVDGSELGDSIVPCGFPLPGVRVYVLDRRRRQVPAGVPGELFLAGIGLARGYLGDPARTAAVFVPDPFAGGGQRMYRTGDLARRRADGRIEFLGRADRQVKIRGHRVEPGEIESVIRQHPGVREVAVVPHGDPARLIAYVAGDVSDGLRDMVAAALPDYLVPNGWVAIESLPLTQHGKVDYGALPDPTEALVRPAHVVPATDTEDVLARIWAQLLDVETVGSDDNFFDLGGHSLLAISLLEEVDSALGVRLTVRSLFEAPDLAAFAASVDRAREVTR